MTAEHDEDDRRDDGGESAAVQRAVGRLEGQLQGHQARLSNFEATTQRQLEAIAKALKDIQVQVGEIKDSKTSIMGGWKVITWFFAAMAGLTLFLIEVSNFLKTNFGK